MDLFDADLLYELEQFAPTSEMPTMLASLASEIVVVGDSTLRDGAMPGGAAGVAVSLADLGAKVALLSVCGDDLGGVLLHKRLISHGVDTSGLAIETGRRTEVTRMPGGVQQVRDRTERFVRGVVDTAGRDADCVLVVDRRGGVVTHQVRRAILALSVRGHPLLMDTTVGGGPTEVAVPGGGTCLTLLTDGGMLLCTTGKGPYRTWATRRRGRGDTAAESAIAMFALGLVAELPHTTSAELFIPLGSSEDDTADAPNPLAALLMLVLGPLAAGLIQLAISRNREYAADADGAHLSADPLALASALDKIDRMARRLPLPADGTHASISHLMIANPLSGHGLSALFRTHPPTPARIRRLQQISRHPSR